MAEEPERFTLRKSCKLRHKSLVDALFRDGKSIYNFPLRVNWRTLTEEQLQENFKLNPPAQIGRFQILITIPKKKRRHAVDRVLMRRRIREAVRLNRHILDEALAARPDIRTLSLAFVYIHNENLPFADIDARVRAILLKLTSKLPS